MRRLWLAASTGLLLSGCWHASQPDESYVEEMVAERLSADSTHIAKPEFSDFADAGSFASADGFYIGGVNPAQSTDEYFDRGDVERFFVETLSATNDEQWILVNRFGLAAGPAQDERLLLLFKKVGGDQLAAVPDGMWRIVRSGRQVRCRWKANQWQAADCG